MSPKLLTFRVDLHGAQPPIWRRIRVRNDISFIDLHHVLQATFNWYGGHLWVFEIFGEEIGSGEGDFDNFWGTDEDDEDSHDEGEHGSVDTALGIYALHPGDAFTYTYDFGDDWEHRLKLEKVEPAPATAPPAELLKAVRAAPPEDCGGIWVYQDLAKAITKPKHADHEWASKVLGDDFDAEAVNEELIRIRLKDYFSPEAGGA